MRILIEEYQYNVADIKDILYGIDALENVEGKVSVHYVGYFYNTLLKDCVFILPKVLLKDVEGQELVFGKYKPESIANLDKMNPLDAVEKKFSLQVCSLDLSCHCGLQERQTQRYRYCISFANSPSW